jgi:hypothetical protein
VIFYIPKGGRVNTDTKIKYNAFKSLKSLLKRGKKLRRLFGLSENLREIALAMETCWQPKKALPPRTPRTRRGGRDDRIRVLECYFNSLATIFSALPNAFKDHSNSSRSLRILCPAGAGLR